MPLMADLDVGSAAITYNRWSTETVADIGSPADGDLIASVANRTLGFPAAVQATGGNKPIYAANLVPTLHGLTATAQKNLAAAVTTDILSVVILCLDSGDGALRYLIARDTTFATTKSAFDLAIVEV